ncbi:MAG: helix-turn-helix transcriptional regulator [Desulfovibrio sp.]|nr:helix-turn-helix transcriptional regulator [Desulfovibrio sp.]
MENLVKKALDARGITPIEASQAGIPYQSVYRQYRGQRQPPGTFALLYERVLGIPLA